MNVDRRDLLFGMLALGVGCVVGCSHTVTKYDSDGKPYTAQETSMVETFFALLLIVGLIGLLAAAGKSDSSNARQRLEFQPGNPPPPNPKLSPLTLRRDGTRVLASTPMLSHPVTITSTTNTQQAILLRALAEDETVILDAAHAESLVRDRLAILAKLGIERNTVVDVDVEFTAASSEVCFAIRRSAQQMFGDAAKS
jgi:hypothetical protein